MSQSSASGSLQFLLLLFSGWVNRHQNQGLDYLMEENRVLRQQLGGRRLQLTDNQRRRLAVKGKILGRRILGEVRGPGRPRTEVDIVELVVMMARANVGWGYTRIRDALRHLTRGIARNTVKRILLDHGIEPAPERNRKTDWKTFIRAHLGEIAGADFFSVEDCRDQP
jgi:putative transposase